MYLFIKKKDLKKLKGLKSVTIHNDIDDLKFFHEYNINVTPTILLIKGSNGDLFIEKHVCDTIQEIRNLYENCKNRY